MNIYRILDFSNELMIIWVWAAAQVVDRLSIASLCAFLREVSY